MARFAVAFCLVLGALFAFELSPPGQAAVRPWTSLVASASAGMIREIDGTARAYGNTVSDTKTGFAVSIEAGCNGVEAMIVLLAGMLAFPASWRQKLAGIVVGVLAVQLLNLVRIVSLFYLGQWSPSAFEWAHLYVWQALIMLDVLIVWLVWMRWVTRAKAQ
ncbi:MAG TPA: exosortase H [Usitatibacter sp.]|nr:exosortase H [Usitatibacter sp.]